VRSVQRPSKPPSLRRNDKRWKRELLAAIQNGDGKKRINQLQNKYRQEDVKEALRRMYRDLCCYCEAKISHVAFDQIEHRKPKAKARFRRLTFDWDNLHLVCPICNQHKSDQWCDTYEILDAAKDRIEDHLTYKSLESGITRWPHDNSKRGLTTICHTDLNRRKLKETRQQLFFRVLDTVQEINKERDRDPGSARAKMILEDLKHRYVEEFGTLTKWTTETFLSRI